MPGTDETNELLREIRDLLAQRERQYEEHLGKTRALYDSQLQAAEKLRRKMMRNLLIVVGLFLSILIGMMVASKVTVRLTPVIKSNERAE
ncbi:MAG: hypothetical protein H0T51_00890 [Pirellulales bacterium]|nr:hypothetical protein [Pirellulales bacterium]